jgi:putative nucleotidyltransferase with HDIG domain
MAYNVGRNIQRIEAFLPPEPGLRAHLFRVSTLAVYTAEHRGLEEKHVEAIAWSALLHHLSSPLGVEGASKLLRDLGLPEVPELEPLPDDVWNRVKGLDKQDAAMVESANLFDEQIENMPYEPESVEESVQALLTSGLISKLFVSALESLRVVTRADLSNAVSKLPVFPKAAMEALRIARDPESGIREMEQAVSRDPVLAGETIQMANSGAFGQAHAVGTLSLALARVGTIAASHLISAAALKRCFASASLNQLWKHSFDTSANTMNVASEAKGVDASDAFLAGLVHDVGRLAYELTPAGAAIREWQEAGFPVTYAELLVSGTDHSEIGAETLAHWRFPERLIEAVRFHHRPEITKSALAAALYAAEDTTESLPSIARDHAAVKRLELAAFPRAQSAG